MLQVGIKRVGLVVKRVFPSAVSLLLFFGGFSGIRAEQTVSVSLSRDGKALMPVVIGTKATEKTRAVASTLAQYLGQIAGVRFEVTIGDGTQGIALGTAADFASLPVKFGLGQGILHREDYALRSHARGIYIVGASDLAVEHGVWDLLYRIGYRQFFPGPTWEIIPAIRNLSVSVDTYQRPSYHIRRIWYGFGTWKYNEKPYADWCARNRATAGLNLQTGHAYAEIVRANKAEFTTHPEYFALVDGRRATTGDTKFCLANPALRKLIVEHALRYFEKNPDADSISLEPSDGDGWCECDQCARMGSITDRVVTLANEVARAIRQKYGTDKFVGIYAYNRHSPPPTIQVAPQVIVSVATAFIKGGLTIDQLMQGWQAKGASIGIREYYSVHAWDHDLPGQARAADLDYLADTLPRFCHQGARFLTSEASDAWGPDGLGYYLASRMLWDANECRRIGPLVDDFLDKAFGPAQKPMADFYRRINGRSKPLLCQDLVGRMYGDLDQACKLTKDVKIQARLRDLTLYTRYVELFMTYQAAKGAARQKAFEELLRFCWQQRQTMMIHVIADFRDLPRRDKTVTMPSEAGYNVPEGKNPWKISQPFTTAEIDGFIARGIAANPRFNFEPIEYGTDLVPAQSLHLPKVANGILPTGGRGKQSFYTWVKDSAATIDLKVTSGLIVSYRKWTGNIRVDLYSPLDVKLEAVCHDVTVPPDGKEHIVRLKTPYRGLHWFTVEDGGNATRVAVPIGVPITLRSSPDARLSSPGGSWSLYFYVPRGIRKIGGFTDSPTGEVLNGIGKKAFAFAAIKPPDYFSIPVSPGQDGKLWKFQNCQGQRLLMTVPPYLARNAEELLLPAKVVQADAKAR